MSLIPDRLITVRWHATAESAQDDKAKLDGAGITAYLTGSHESGYTELRVPERELERAVEALGITPEDLAVTPPDSGGRCPECGSDLARKLPPYARYVFLCSSALGLLFLLLGKGPVGGVCIVAGWFSTMWLGRYSGHSRCTICGHLFRN